MAWYENSPLKYLPYSPIQPVFNLNYCDYVMLYVVLIFKIHDNFILKYKYITFSSWILEFRCKKNPTTITIPTWWTEKGLDYSCRNSTVHAMQDVECRLAHKWLAALRLYIERPAMRDTNNTALHLLSPFYSLIPHLKVSSEIKLRKKIKSIGDGFIPIPRSCSLQSIYSVFKKYVWTSPYIFPLVCN